MEGHPDYDSGYMFIASAIESGDLKAVSELLNFGINPNVQGYTFNSTPLIEASAENQTELVKLLLEKGANVNLQNNNGTTALIFACLKDNEEMVKALLQHNPILHLKNAQGKTAFDSAHGAVRELIRNKMLKYFWEAIKYNDCRLHALSNDLLLHIVSFMQ